MITIKKALKEDAKRLTEIQKASFDDELRQFSSNELGGPPGYDSEEWQIEMMQHGQYYKIISNDEIVGGAIILIEQNDVLCLGRIFIDPGVQNQGIGTEAMKDIELEFQTSRKWWLDTPSWSLRNHHFYSKCGYTKIKEEHDMFIFEKISV